MPRSPKGELDAPGPKVNINPTESDTDDSNSKLIKRGQNT
jgi:hypothetical protein